MTIHEYISNWQSIEGVKPKNEEVFITLFLEWLNSVDDVNDFEFDGEGSYFGHQITIIKDRRYWGKAGFECCYSLDRISIYTVHHDGYWVPEYIDMDHQHSQYWKLRSALFEKLMWAFGLNNLKPVSEEPF